MEQGLLLVDDEPNILKSLERILEEDGYTIYTATSGKDALVILSQSPVEVIISDQRMPHMTGAEFLTQVKQLYPQTARIILSAYSDFNALKDAINNGAIYKFINKPWDIEAIRTLVREAFRLQAPFTEATEGDSITGLPNRILFNKRFDEVIAGAQLNNQSFAIVLVHLGGADRINDILGEANGDKILRLMANRLIKWVGSEAELLSIGRDKYCLLLSNVSKSNLSSRIKTLFVEINKPVHHLNEDYFLNATMGVSLFPEHGDTYFTLLKHADYARIRCNKLGENNYQIYNKTMGLECGELISEKDIHRALEKNEFIVYYQPIVSAISHQIVGAEALVRWVHPQHGFLPPNSFIPFCEETGLIIKLGAFVLLNACEQLKKWHQKNNNLFVAVNISPRQLRDIEFLKLLNDTLTTINIVPQSLELEITESIMMYDVGYHIDLMQKIAAISVKLSVDDFGTGFSSLSYLKLLPIQKLKIDQSFVKDISTSKKNRDIISSIIALAKMLGLILVAEGVETKAQLAFLKRKKCDQIQGFIFSEPVSAEEFELLLETNTLRPKTIE
jgi:diguanylate cyclase (GGDEF)-like protein